MHSPPSKLPVDESQRHPWPCSTSSWTESPTHSEAAFGRPNGSYQKAVQCSGLYHPIRWVCRLHFQWASWPCQGLCLMVSQMRVADWWMFLGKTGISLPASREKSPLWRPYSPQIFCRWKVVLHVIMLAENMKWTRYKLTRSNEAVSLQKPVCFRVMMIVNAKLLTSYNRRPGGWFA